MDITLGAGFIIAKKNEEVEVKDRASLKLSGSTSQEIMRIGAAMICLHTSLEKIYSRK
jgi:hypothetical protein